MAIKAGQLKERADYQAYILEMLEKGNGYQVRPSTAYDPGYGMDVELLFSFLQATQPDALARLEKSSMAARPARPSSTISTMRSTRKAEAYWMY